METTGDALEASQARRIVRMAAQRAELELNVSQPRLRHGHASHALHRSASIVLVLVRDTHGHSSVAVTDRYLHARPGESPGRFLAV